MYGVCGGPDEVVVLYEDIVELQTFLGLESPVVTDVVSMARRPQFREERFVNRARVF